MDFLGDSDRDFAPKNTEDDSESVRRLVDDQGAAVVWGKTRNSVRNLVGAEDFEKWISDIVFVAEIDNAAVLAAESRVERDRVIRDYSRKIEMAWRMHDPRRRPIRIEAMSDLPEDIRALAGPSRVTRLKLVSPTPAERESEASEEGLNDFADGDDLRADDSFDMHFGNLVVRESNQQAATIARKLATGAAGPVSVVFFHGVHGVGKTHLMRATERLYAETFERESVVYMSAEEFLVTFMEGVQKRDTSAQRRMIRRARLILLDDIHLIASKKGTLSEFFSHVRYVTQRGGRVALSADVAPGELDGLDSRVRDEIQGGVSFEIGEPDLEMRQAIIRSKIGQIAMLNPEFRWEESWIEMTAQSLNSSGRLLTGVVSNVFAATAMQDLPVRYEDVENAVRSRVGERRSPSLSVIKDVVCKHFGITREEIDSHDRRRSFARPRQIAMYLAKRLTPFSFPQIGRDMGKRDHSTILYGCRRVETLMNKDRDLARLIARLEQMALDDPRNRDSKA